MRPRIESILCGCIVSFVIVTLTSYAFGLPDCDGSAAQSGVCGTATACSDPEENPDTSEWYCPNSAIVRQTIQHLCSEGSGSGSTLCEATSTPLVCTKSYPCELSELKNPETGEITSRSCARALSGEGADGSTASKTDNVLCRDTSGG